MALPNVDSRSIVRKFNKTTSWFIESCPRLCLSKGMAHLMAHLYWLSCWLSYYPGLRPILARISLHKEPFWITPSNESFPGTLSGSYTTANYHIAGNFAFFEGRVNTKIKTGINSHAPVFYMQSSWWVWFPGIETQILEPMNISAEGSGTK